MEAVGSVSIRYFKNTVVAFYPEARYKANATRNIIRLLHQQPIILICMLLAILRTPEEYCVQEKQAINNNYPIKHITSNDYRFNSLLVTLQTMRQQAYESVLTTLNDSKNIEFSMRELQIIEASGDPYLIYMFREFLVEEIAKTILRTQQLYKL